jgi:hypothetical protein
MMDTQTYRTSDKLTGAVIVLGSDRPTKVWAKVRFGKSGDLYWMCDTVKDVDRTDEHMSLHRSGEVWSTVQGKRRKAMAIGSTNPKEVQSGTERLEEGYLYHWLPTFQKAEAREEVAVCLDLSIVGSTLKCTVDMLNGEDGEAIGNVIGKRLNVNDPRSHALVFYHQGRTLILCLHFDGGTGPIEQSKVDEADSLVHQKKKLFAFDELHVS